ncbi:MAG: hypothetical protein ACFB9M_08130 [Myxococcota bacterium]
METSSHVPSMVEPSLGSTVVFVVVVLAVCGMLVAAVGYAHSDRTSAAVRRRIWGASLVLVAILISSGTLAESGMVHTLAWRPAFAAFPLFWNGLALGFALSPVGRNIAIHLPVTTLVGFQAFRLPLELVLHRWYLEGVMPVQMTFAGHNFDIVTGALALFVALGLWRGLLPKAVVWGFNLLGLGLLFAVVRIAVLSSPVPFRSYMNEPLVLLAFHAPYVWIISICVAGALFGHVVTFRWLLIRR